MDLWGWEKTGISGIGKREKTKESVNKGHYTRVWNYRTTAAMKNLATDSWNSAHSLPLSILVVTLGCDHQLW